MIRVFWGSDMSKSFWKVFCHSYCIVFSFFFYPRQLRSFPQRRLVVQRVWSNQSERRVVLRRCVSQQVPRWDLLGGVWRRVLLAQNGPYDDPTNRLRFNQDLTLISNLNESKLLECTHNSLQHLFIITHSCLWGLTCIAQYSRHWYQQN